MGNKLISIGVLVYNHEKFIKQNIDSIINQTYKNIELIILDDGSTDNSLKQLKKITKDIKFKFELMSQKNKGAYFVGHNFNIILSKVTGEYCLLISGDDVLKPDALKKMTAILDENEKIQFCTGDKVDLIDSKGKKINEEIKFPIYNQNHKKISQTLKTH